jgi:GT2 family glycosyltransferase
MNKKCQACDGRGVVYMAMHTPPIEIGCSECNGYGWIEEKKFTWIINTYKSLPYLKLSIQSIRENAYYKNQPIIVYCENDSETYEWLAPQQDIKIIFEVNVVPKGIGGGVNECVKRVKTEFFSLIHSDMVLSRHYDKPLFDLVSATDKPLVACAWRLEPNIFNNQDRVGTTFAPVDGGFGVYHHDFDNKGFLDWADEFVKNDYPSYRKVEGVSYMMRTKYFIPNLDAYRPSSFEDMHQNVIMQLKGYDFVVTPKALVWHFGARSSHFLGQHDKLVGTSDRQKQSEAKNYKIWVDLWGEPPSYDQFGQIKVTNQMKERYNKNPQLYHNPPIS